MTAGIESAGRPIRKGRLAAAFHFEMIVSELGGCRQTATFAVAVANEAKTGQSKQHHRPRSRKRSGRDGAEQHIINIHNVVQDIDLN